MQPSLFSQNPCGTEPASLAANADPQTSAEAAATHARNGKVARNRQISMALVVASPGLTGYELWVRANEEQKADLVGAFELYRRLADLKNQQLVVRRLS